MSSLCQFLSVIMWLFLTVSLNGFRKRVEKVNITATFCWKNDRESFSVCSLFFSLCANQLRRKLWQF